MPTMVKSSPPVSSLSPTTMYSPSFPTDVVEVDKLGNLHILSDGSVFRSRRLFSTPILNDGTVQWKDLLFDPANGLYLRLFRPTTPTTAGSKLPIVFFLYGGGFVAGSRTWNHFHNFSHRLASHLPAILVSPDFRLAPENRLPAAIDDCASAIAWLRSQAAAADEWLTSVADFSKLFLIGYSSGGNIAHHLAVRFAPAGPVRIRGCALLDPFFGGTRRTQSEVDCAKGAKVNLEVCDKLWELSLPVGADRDHPVANPFGRESAGLEAVELAPVLVVVADSVLLKDRGREYGERLKGMGKKAEVVEFEGQQHGFFLDEPQLEASVELMGMLKKFILDNGNSVTQVA